MRREPKVALDPWFLTITELEPFLDATGRLSWPAYFGNGNPVEIDVGCGRGMFLVKSATTTPDVNFLGIEVDLREAKRTARRLVRRRQPNARVLGADVREVFLHQVEPGSVSALHVYFPDPWWKRKHRRRRVFTDEFVELAAKVLKPGGLLHSWTDVEEYFGVISGLMNHAEWFEALPPPAERPPQNDLDFQTSFERRQRQEGATIHRGLWRRRS